MGLKLKRETERECRFCKTIFLVTVRNNKKLFCSQDCANKYHNKIKCEDLRDARNRRQNNNGQSEEGDI